MVVFKAETPLSGLSVPFLGSRLSYSQVNHVVMEYWV